MGYDRCELTVSATVSRHNSPRDDEHDALWDELRARVEAVVSDPKYTPIGASTW